MRRRRCRTAVDSLLAATRAHLRALATAHLAPATLASRRVHLARGLRWFAADGTTAVGQIGIAALDAVVDAMAAHRTNRGRPLSATTVASFLTTLRQFLRWGATDGVFPPGLADRLGRPRMPERLPSAVLSARDVARLLARVVLRGPMGIRDRTILELLYAVGIRRSELTALDLGHIDLERAVLYVRDGKGRRDRLLPLTPRVLHWLQRYLREARPRLARGGSPDALFLSARGVRVQPKRLTCQLHGHVVRGGSGKSGSCHIFRHTAATLMHDRGADIRDLQHWLGHRSLATTQLYTRVSVERLREVVRKTHPCHGLARDGEASSSGGDSGDEGSDL